MKSILAALAFAAFAAQTSQPQPQPMETDPSYDARIANPAYTTSHPEVLFDEAHLNFHTPETRYRPFSELISNDGYHVVANHERFSAATLAGHRILVIANARGAEGTQVYSAPAFTDEEAQAVAQWVRAGGSLLLIADHAPFGAAAENLAKAFGVDMSKGVTADRAHSDPASGNPSFVYYTRAAGMIGDHPITRGRNPAERINSVMTFSGQSLRGPEGSTGLLTLSQSAFDTPPPNPADIEAAVAAARQQAKEGGAAGPIRLRLPQSSNTSAAGRAQAIAFACGKGRVVVAGEAAMLSAQITQMNGKPEPIGMNRPGLDNRQFALNIMHWLSGALD